MDLDLFDDLIAFQNYGTLSKAADARHTTQPTLSRNMQKLEYELGCSLFDKTGNKLELNENGLTVIRYAILVRQDLERLRYELEQNERKKTQISFASCAPRPLDILYAKLNNIFPEMSLTGTLAESGDLISDMKNGLYQIIITAGIPKDPEIVSGILCTEKLYLSVRSDHELASKPAVSFQELDGLKFLLNRRIGIWKNLVEEKMPHSSFLLQHNAESLDYIAASSDIPAFTTDLMIRENGLRQNHKAIPISDPESKITFRYCFRAADSFLFSSF